MDSKELTSEVLEGLRHVYNWHNNITYDFYYHLVDLICYADDNNRRLLFKSYPGIVIAYKTWCAQGNDVFVRHNIK